MNWTAFAIYLALPVVFVLAVVLCPWGRNDDDSTDRPRGHVRRPR